MGCLNMHNGTPGSSNPGERRVGSLAVTKEMMDAKQTEPWVHVLAFFPHTLDY